MVENFTEFVSAANTQERDGVQSYPMPQAGIGSIRSGLTASTLTPDDADNPSSTGLALEERRKSVGHTISLERFLGVLLLCKGMS
jgi:hypothetical protein